MRSGRTLEATPVASPDEKIAAAQSPMSREERLERLIEGLELMLSEYIESSRELSPAAGELEKRSTHLKMMRLG